MSMKALITSSVGVAFGAIGDLKATVDYQSSGGTTYDPVTGIISRNDTVISMAVVLSGYSQQEMVKSPIVIGDQKMLCQAEDLGVEPKSEDQVVINGSTWEIVDFFLDVSESIYTFQLRKSGS